jgi:hypothetical protein
MSRPLRLIECNRCRSPILIGLDDIGLEVHADLIPLTRLGELHAIASGLTSWRLDADRKAWRTDEYRLRSDAPFPSDHRIAAHSCGRPPPPEWIAPPPPPARHSSTDPNGDPQW